MGINWLAHLKCLKTSVYVSHAPEKIQYSSIKPKAVEPQEIVRARGVSCLLRSRPALAALYTSPIVIFLSALDGSHRPVSQQYTNVQMRLIVQTSLPNGAPRLRSYHPPMAETTHSIMAAISLKRRDFNPTPLPVRAFLILARSNSSGQCIPNSGILRIYQ